MPLEHENTVNAQPILYVSTHIILVVTRAWGVTGNNKLY